MMAKKSKTTKAAKPSKKQVARAAKRTKQQQIEVAPVAASVPAPEPPPAEPPMFGNRRYDTPAELTHTEDAIQILSLLMSHNFVRFDAETWGQNYADGYMEGVRLIAGALHRLEQDQVVLGLAE